MARPSQSELEPKPVEEAKASAPNEDTSVLELTAELKISGEGVLRMLKESKRRHDYGYSITSGRRYDVVQRMYDDSGLIVATLDQVLPRPDGKSWADEVNERKRYDSVPVIPGRIEARSDS